MCGTGYLTPSLAALAAQVNHFRGRIRDPNAPVEGGSPRAAPDKGAPARDASGAPPKKKAAAAAPDEQAPAALPTSAPPPLLHRSSTPCLIWQVLTASTPCLIWQVLTVANERISVPELLFHPSDIGLDQAGVHETALQAVEACVPDLREALLANVVLVGGSSNFPNYAERLQAELRQVPTTTTRN